MTGMLCRLARSEEGATIVEFGMVAPILLLAIMGVFDMGHTIYTSVVIRGSIQKAARDATIEGAGARSVLLDSKVTAAVHAIMPQAVVTFDRKSYTSFTNVARPEDYNDVNGDGVCGNGEPFEDANGNGVFDRDRGIAGQGGARDAVLYTVTVTYTRVFPMARLAGFSNLVTTTSKSVLRNQPYAQQDSTAPKIGTCA